MPTIRVWTVGHSTRTLDGFLGLLRAHGVRTVADVRTIPKSRRHPHFAGEALAAALAGEGIGYVHLPELGGRRHPRPDSPNGGWRNEGFRGYADHMATEGFERGVERLLALAETGSVAAMCAEAVPWRCHRSLLADALVARGMAAEHILSSTATQPHRLTPFARVDGRQVSYPPVQERML